MLGVRVSGDLWPIGAAVVDLGNLSLVDHPFQKSVVAAGGLEEIQMGEPMSNPRAAELGGLEQPWESSKEVVRTRIGENVEGLEERG